MQATRLEKINRLVQKELSEIFRLETAKTSERGTEMIANINANATAIRYDLAGRLRYQLRRTPELTFYIDDSLDYIEHIDELLKQ